VNNGKSKAILFPHVQCYLQISGQIIRLAGKRRHWTTENLAARAYYSEDVEHSVHAS